MLPLDYADRGVARQRRNVGRLIGFTSLVIVAIGAFRLSQSLKSEEENSKEGGKPEEKT